MHTPWWKRFDWILAGASLLLLFAGLAMIASSTLGTSQPYAVNQLVFVVLGLAVFAVCMRVGYQWLVAYAPVWYGITVVLLIAVALFGRITRGAISWLSVGPFAVQPSEFAKLALILLLGWLVAFAQERQWDQWRILAVYGAALIAPLVLIAIQPDLGTAAVLAFAWLVCVWMSPLNKRVLAGVVIIALLLAASAWLVMEPYQRTRVTTFLNPSAQPLGAGYNVLQSQIAVGSGQWFGRGWGRGTQSHLNFLPEHHTDFIFASLSEEFGFVGAMVVLGLYGILLWRGARLSWRAKDYATVVVASGITMMILFQAGVNMAMNVGLAPVTGIPLPLVSYGGSSLLTVMAGLGVLESVAVSEDLHVRFKT